MNYRVYLNRYNADKTKFTDIVVINKKRLQHLKSLSWIVICKITKVDEPCNFFFSIYPIFNFNVYDRLIVEKNIDKIRPVSLKGWI